MKVLVTGGCGFIGSHVCEFYRNLGWEVISYDNLTKYELDKTGYDANLARSSNYDFLTSIGVGNIEKDIRNYTDILAAADGCDYIIHTAAQPAMTLSIDDPSLDLTSNVVGTFNVLQVARELKIPVVSCASIHVYGTGINASLKEGDSRYRRIPATLDEAVPVLTGVMTPLHASKFSAECYVRTFIETYKVKAASFRLTGLYGPRQFGGEDHGWVANFAIRALTNRPITIFNTGKQVRDILYATDLCRAFHAFYVKQIPGIYNIGGGEQTAISLLESIYFLEELLNKKISFSFGGERWGDLYYWISDCRKAERLLEWRPSVLPKEGITKMVEWVNDNLAIFK